MLSRFSLWANPYPQFRNLTWNLKARKPAGRQARWLSGLPGGMS